MPYLKNQIRLLTCLMLNTSVSAWPGQEECVPYATALILKYGDIDVSQGKLSLTSWCFSRQISLLAQYSRHRSMLTPCVRTTLRAVGIGNMSFKHCLNTLHASIYLSGYTWVLYDFMILPDSSPLKMPAVRKRSSLSVLPLSRVVVE